MCLYEYLAVENISASFSIKKIKFDVESKLFSAYKYVFLYILNDVKPIIANSWFSVLLENRRVIK
jgi:hypothetical protein